MLKNQQSWYISAQHKSVGDEWWLPHLERACELHESPHRSTVHTQSASQTYERPLHFLEFVIPEKEHWLCNIYIDSGRDLDPVMGVISALSSISPSGKGR